jgi:hypothetical protein
LQYQYTKGKILSISLQVETEVINGNRMRN